MTDNPLLVSSNSEIRTEELVSRLLSDFKDQYGLDIADDPAAVKRIQEAVRNSLWALERQGKAEIFLPYISANAAGPIHLQRTISLVEPGQTGAEPKTEDTSEEGQEVPQRVQVPLPDGKPLVTYSLLVIMVLLYLLQLLTNFVFYQDLPAALGMKINQAILDGQYWRLITPMFLHGSILHLGFNLYALFILGRRIERFFGSFRFLMLFLIAGMTGNLFSFIFTPAPSLGSSTAIFGLLAAEGVFIYQHRDLFGDRSKVALRQIVQVAVINLLIGLSPGIDNWGHMGGLVGGLMFAWFAGPIFKLERVQDRLRFTDQRSIDKAIPVFILQLVLLIFVTAWMIISGG